MALTQDVKDKIILALADGKSQRRIATDNGVTLTTVQKISKDFKEDVEQLQAENKERLINTYATIKQAHLKSIADTLTSINAELQTRPLTDVSTDKLFEYKLKYEKELIAEYEKEPQIYNDGGAMEGLADYETELTRLYNDVITGKVKPAQAKILQEILGQRRDYQRRIYDRENATALDLMEMFDNGNPY